MDDILDKLDSGFSDMDVGKIYGNVIGHIEKIVIVKMLERSHGNQVMAARRLGLHRNTLHNKVKKFNIDVGRFKR